MKIEFNKTLVAFIVSACIVITFAVLLVFAFINISSIADGARKLLTILYPFIYGLVIAYLINPIYKRAYKAFSGVGRKKKKKKLRTVLSLLVTYAIVIGLISVFILIAVPQIVKSYNTLVSHLKGYVNDAGAWLNTLIGGSDFISAIYDKLSEGHNVSDITAMIQKLFTGSYGAFSAIMPYILSFLSGLFTGVKNGLIGLIISVYILASKDILCAQVEKSFFAFVPEKKARSIETFFYYVDHTFGQFLIGKILDSIIIGILTFIVMTIFRIPYTPLISVIVGVTNVIPFFGPFIGAVPSVFFVFIDDPVKAIWTIVIIFVIQQLDGNIIGPKIIGETTGISSLWIVVSILLFGGLFGIVGMVVAVPLFSVIYKLFKDSVEHRLEEKGMSPDTVDYVGKSPLIIEEEKRKKK